jgi:hypothetical protein
MVMGRRKSKRFLSKSLKHTVKPDGTISSTPNFTVLGREIQIQTFA